MMVWPEKQNATRPKPISRPDVIHKYVLTEEECDCCICCAISAVRSPFQRAAANTVSTMDTVVTVRTNERYDINLGFLKKTVATIRMIEPITM